MTRTSSDNSPDYNSNVCRSTFTAVSTGSVEWESFGSPPPFRQSERYVYTYSLLAGLVPLEILISVEPAAGQPGPGKYTFRLSFVANDLERTLCEPVILQLAVDPRQLDFVVFLLPGKTCIPAGCLYSLRVWLRVNNVDQRLFGEDELWIGKDPRFYTIEGASFSRLNDIIDNMQIYHAVVGNAHVSFVVKWQFVSERLYKFSMEYEAGGVGGTLFEDFRLGLSSDPRAVTFLIYAVPIKPVVPAGALHRLSVWLRTVADPSSSASFPPPFTESYIYQRIWKMDSFKIGRNLDFASLGNKMITGSRARGPQTVVMASPSEARVGYEGGI